MPTIPNSHLRGATEFTCDNFRCVFRPAAMDIRYADRLRSEKVSRSRSRQETSP